MLGTATDAAQTVGFFNPHPAFLRPGGTIALVEGDSVELVGIDGPASQFQGTTVEALWIAAVRGQTRCCRRMTWRGVICAEQVYWLDRVGGGPWRTASTTPAPRDVDSIRLAAAAAARRLWYRWLAVAFAALCADGAWREALARYDGTDEPGLGCATIPFPPIVPAILIGIWPWVPVPERPALLTELWPEVGYTRSPRAALAAVLRSTGFASPTAHPSPPRALYRGAADPERARRLSWTDDLRVTRFFARRFGGRHRAVYRAELRTADAILAYFSHRMESEYVLDPSGLVNLERVRRRRSVQLQPSLPLEFQR